MSLPLLRNLARRLSGVYLGGLAAGTNHSRLDISGSASLSGNLQASLINGFSPTAGDTFEILTFRSYTAPGLSPELPGLGDSMQLEVQPNDTGLNLVTVGDPSSPPPGSHPPGGGAVQPSGTQPANTFTTRPERLPVPEGSPAEQRGWAAHERIDAFFHHRRVAADNSKGSSGRLLGYLDRLAETSGEAIPLSDATRSLRCPFLGSIATATQG